MGRTKKNTGSNLEWIETGRTTLNTNDASANNDTNAFNNVQTTI
jgi:hypothetical protein